MAYEAGTNRKAKDISAYIMQQLRTDDSNSFGFVFDNTITTGSSVINTCAIAARNTLITGYETDFEALQGVWSFSKSASNPLLAIANGSGGLEFYPPCVRRLGATDWVVMGKAAWETWGSTSSDGISWGAPTKLVSKGTGTDWDLDLTAPNVLIKDGSTFKLLYSGYNVTNPSNPNQFDYKVGLATASTFLGTWTKEASYIYTVDDYNTNNASSWDGIQVSDAVKIGNKWYYFGTVFNNAFDDGAIVYGIGDEDGDFEDIRMDTKIADYDEINSLNERYQYPNVFKHPTTGEWQMTLNMGDGDVTVTQEITFYCLNSGNTSEPIFTRESMIYNAIMLPDVTKTYENGWNYEGVWLKDNGGILTQVSSNYYFYYAGHSINTEPTIYTGAMCLATIATIP